MQPVSSGDPLEREARVLAGLRAACWPGLQLQCGKAPHHKAAKTLLSCSHPGVTSGNAHGPVESMAACSRRALCQRCVHQHRGEVGPTHPLDLSAPAWWVAGEKHGKRLGATPFPVLSCGPCDPGLACFCYFGSESPAVDCAHRCGLCRHVLWAWAVVSVCVHMCICIYHAAGPSSCCPVAKQQVQ